MQSVFIYFTGSCNVQTREGSTIVLTEQGSEKRLRTFNYSDTTANRCIIHGLIDGVLQLDAPHHVVLVTLTPVGAVSASKGKGPWLMNSSANLRHGNARTTLMFVKERVTR